MFLQPCNLVGIALQPGPHVFGHVVGVEGAAVAVAEDGFRAVVVADDDEAAIVVDVKDVETADLARLG